MKLGPAARRIFLLCLGVWASGKLCAAPAVFRVPVEAASRAILDFAQQAGIEVLFPYDQLQRVKSAAIDGSYEPEEALTRLLQGTGFVAQKNGRGTFVVVAAPQAPQPRPTLKPSPVETSSAPGSRQEAATHLDAVLVNAQTENSTRMHLGTADVAAGNLDLDRTAEDALPYTVIDRSRIITSGAVNLNDFLRRELLESDAASQSVDQQGQSPLFAGGSTNLNLRGYGEDETLVLVNGRQLPQVLSSGLNNSYTTRQPDVNLIPLSLVERVEVLPVSASAVYSGDPVGGVVNIILRPVENVTEITANYSNALHGYDAPQSTLSLLHGETLLGGKLQLRLDADFAQIVPPTETELGYIQQKLRTYPNLDGPFLFRATPNVTTVLPVSSPIGTPLPPLFGPGTPATASVAPGADGTGGYAALAARQGVPSLALFRSPGGMDDSPDSINYSYGRQEKSSEYYFSASYDVTPWLQIGWDGLYSHAVSHNGYSVFPQTLNLTAGTPLDPFDQTVQVMLNETAPKLGGTYDEAQRNVYSSVLGALLKLPDDWRLSLDAQYSESVVRYRGLAGVDSDAWQKLVDEGVYNPLRDTQVYGPPQAFYDQALLYFGGPGKFVTLDDYQNLIGAVRLTRTTMPLPTGTGTVNLGVDYSRDHLADFDDTQVHGDGSIGDTSGLWGGRTLERYSVFGEMQAPLVPAQWLPKWIKQVEVDGAARYVASDTSGGAHVSPTVAVKIDFPGGLSARASVSTTNRFPTPTLSRFTPTVPGTAGKGAAGIVTGVSIQDPLRGNATYSVQSSDTPDEAVHPEADLTRSAGLVYHHGTTHQLTASLDFFDTRKSYELDYLAAQDVIGLEAELPGRVIRAPGRPGDPYGAGVITSVLTGNVNVASRSSQNWNLSLDYTENGVCGGALTIYTRWVYFQSFERQLLANSGVVDELGHPDVASLELMRNRVNFGGQWASKLNAFGIDAEYFGRRQLPEFQWIQQQSHHIAPYCQVDAFVKTDLTRFLPWEKSRYGLSLQLRVNNVFSASFPKYIDDPSGSGLGAYGDWRGRVYSISVTATF